MEPVPRLNIDGAWSKCGTAARALDSTPCDAIELARVLVELSSRFAHASTNEVDAAIKRSLQDISSYAHADRSVVWQFEENGPGLIRTYEWFHQGFIPYSNEMLIDGFRWGRTQLKNGETLAFRNLTLLPPEANGDRRVFEQTHHSSVTGVPLLVEGRVIGALCVYGNDPSVYTRLPRWRFLGDVMANVLDRRFRETSLRALENLVESLQLKLEGESLNLEDLSEESGRAGGMIGESPCFKKVLRLLDRVAQADTTVLITGETGTGKELVARAIHELSPRRRRSMVMVNCAALPPNLIESELFGHEAGAFTGARTTKIGRFEAADQGTLFLDEIGELPLDLQAKLLRVLQEGEFERLGSVTTRKVNIRVVAATNVDLLKAVNEMRFRRDLYYRLNVIPVHCPPLRERVEDIPLLAEHFVNQFNRQFGKSIHSISEKAQLALRTHPWPGNIRELRNTMERAVLLSSKPRLTLADLFPDDAESAPPSGIVPLGEEQRDYILRVLQLTNWRVSGPHGASALLGLNPKTLESRMKKLGIVRPSFHLTR